MNYRHLPGLWSLIVWMFLQKLGGFAPVLLPVEEDREETCLPLPHWNFLLRIVMSTVLILIINTSGWELQQVRRAVGCLWGRVCCPKLCGQRQPLPLQPPWAGSPSVLTCAPAPLGLLAAPQVPIHVGDHHLPDTGDHAHNPDVFWGKQEGSWGTSGVRSSWSCVSPLALCSHGVGAT